MPSAEIMTRALGMHGMYNIMPYIPRAHVITIQLTGCQWIWCDSTVVVQSRKIVDAREATNFRGIC